MTSEPLGIGLLGYGTVGSSVDRLLRERADVVERVAGRPVRVVRALVRDAARPREGAAPGLLTDRFEDIRDDPSIKVVAEVMGGVEPTLGYLRELLERGVSVVSANKQLLARYGAELQEAADRGGAQLRYEASACAAIPVVRVLQESLAAAGVDELIGIVNGTTNFMLTAMARDGRSYADALAEAQELGYAEADPTEDVGGADAAAKLAILASLAFHRHLHIDDVPFEGIDTLHDDDVAFANELGYAVKLLAHARLSAEGIAASVGARARAARAPAGTRQRQLQRRHAARPRDPRDHAAGARRRRRRDRDRRDRRPALGARAAPEANREPPSASCRSSRRAAPAARSTSISRSPTGPASWPASRRASAIAASRSAP